MTKENKKDNVFLKIHENYKCMNELLVAKLDISSKHDGLTGNYREEMWMDFFRDIIPRKFSMDQGVMIIDSYNNVSKEVDIAVFDKQYTPYVFQYNSLKFIPIEAVAIVIECKSKNLDEDTLIEWARVIDELKTKRSGISRIVSGYASGLTNKVQKNTRPIKILACTKTNQREYSIENMKKKYGDKFDFIISKRHNGDTFFEVHIDNKDKTLAWWGNKLNGVEDAPESQKNCNLKIEHLSGKKEEESLKRKEERLKKECPELQFDEKFCLKNTLKDLEVTGNPLLSLNLQLNQLLMLINNPMLFPHFAYAKAFNKIVAEMENEKAANNKQKES